MDQTPVRPWLEYSQASSGLTLRLSGFDLRLLLIAAIHAIERFKDCAGRKTTNRIPNRLAIAPRRDKSILAQQRKMLRHRRVSDPERGRQFANRALALDKLTHDHQPMAV